MKKITLCFGLLFTLFFSEKAFAQPANDACGSAQSVTPDGSCVSGTTVGAADNWTGTVGCQTGGGSHPDVWYSFTATGSSFTTTVTTSGSWTGDVEYILVQPGVLGCAGTLTTITSSCGASPLTVSYNGLTSGTTYYFSISTDAGGTTGPFQVCTQTTTPPAGCVDNDACADAATITYTPNVQACLTDCNTGAMSGPDFTGANCYDFPNETVWYSVTTGAATATMDVSVTSTDFSTPYFTVFTNVCNPYTIVNCQQGSGGTVTGNNIAVNANTEYLIAVSDVNGGTGNFDLCVTVEDDNSACNTTNSLTVTATSMGSPLAGPYKPGELVTFQYTITDFQQINCNYLHGIVPSFGDCWDPVSFDAQGKPVNIVTPLATAFNLQCPAIGPCGYKSCENTPSGTWSWFTAGAVTYNNIAGGSLPPNTPMPPGWFFLNSYDPAGGDCGPDPTDPDNSYGDGSLLCNQHTGDWQVSFQLQARGCNTCGGNTDCSVSVKTYSDGETGIWNSVGCVVDVPTVFNATMACSTPISNAGSDVSFCSGSSAVLGTTATAGWSYSWNPATGLSSATASDPTVTLTNGGASPVTTSYVVTTTDAASGCSSTDTVSVTVNPAPATPSAGSNSPICTGSTLNLTSTTITGATYSWSGPGGFTSTLEDPTRPSATTAMSGTYSVVAIANGCTSTVATTAVTVNAIPATPTAGSNSPVCAGSTLNLTSTTIAGATYSWSGPNSFTSTLEDPSIASVTTAATGTYSVVAIANACTSAAGTVSVTINAKDDPAFNYSSATYCQTGTDPSANITGGFTGTFSATPAGLVFLNTSTGLIDLSMSGLNTYTIKFVTNGSCKDSATFNVTITTSPSAAFSYSGPYCQNGSPNPSPTFGAGASAGTFSGTPAGLNFVSTSTGQIDLTASAPGTYKVYNDIAAGGGCAAAKDSANVTITAQPSTPIAGSNSPICAGQTLNLTTNTISGATYSWTGPNSFTSSLEDPPIASATTAATGTYSVTTTVNGCTSPVGTVSVTVNAIPAAPTATSNGPICAGNSLNLNASTVTGATYNWTGPNSFTSTSQNPTITSATTAATGTYSVVSIANACTSAAETVVVTVNAIPATPSAGSNSPICAGSTLNLTSNTIAGATYSWSGPGGFTSTSEDPTRPSATTSMSGTYSVVAIANACTSATGTVVVTVDAIPATPVAGSNGPICAGSTLNLTSTTITGATYSWTGPNSFTSTVEDPSITSATTAASGTYSVVAIANACTSAAGTVIVTVNAIPAAPTAGSNTPICEGNDLNLTASTVGSATYNWTGPNSFSSGLQNPTITAASTAASGTYSVTATENSCTSPAGTVNVTVNAVPSTPTLGSNSPVCSGSDLNITATSVAGATYEWTGPNSFTSTSEDPTITAATTAASGTYSVVTIANACTSAVTAIDVIVNPSVTFTITTSNPTVCGGTDGSITITGLMADSVYSITYTKNGTIIGPVNLTATSGQIVLGSLGEGSYTDITLELNGCSTIDNITYDLIPPGQPAAPTASASPNPICEGDAINLFSSTVAGATYMWTGPNGFTSGAEDTVIATSTAAMSGVYSVVAIASGCTSSVATVDVVINPIPTTIASASPNPICEGDAINLFSSTVTGATYSWTGPNGFISGAEDTTIANSTMAMAGTYSVLVIANGCSSSVSTVDVVINQLPTATASASPNPICEGDAINLFSSTVTGATYMWTGPNGFTSGAEDTIINSSTLVMSGLYDLIVIVNGCTSAVSQVIVNINPLPSVIVTATNAGCGSNDGTITASGSGATPYTYSLNGGTPVNNSTFSGLAPGVYVITIQDANSCTSATEVTVGQNEGPEASFTATPDNGNAPLTVLLTNTSQRADSVRWFVRDSIAGESTATDTVVHVFNGEGSYSISLYAYRNKCLDTFSLTITVIGESIFEIPNVFTPNGDGINEQFIVKARNVVSIEGAIYNRWGKKLFEWNDPNIGWDGTAPSGDRVPDGTYYYMIKGETADGKVYEDSGPLNLFR